MADIKLKNSSGTEQSYSGVKHIKVPEQNSNATITYTDTTIAANAATAADIAPGKNAWVNNELVEGTMPTATVTPATTISGTGATVTVTGQEAQRTLTLSSNVSNTPNILYSNGNSGGYVTSGTTGSSSVSLSTPAINLTPGNIKDGVTIFGVEGSYEGSGTSVAVQTNKGYSVSAAGEITITPDSDYDAMSQVTLSVPSAVINFSNSLSSSGVMSYSSDENNHPTFYSTINISPTVTTEGYVSTISSSDSSVPINVNFITTKGADVYYTSTQDQSILFNTLLTGNQIIKGVSISSDLIPENIKQGVTIEIGDNNDLDRLISVTGTYTGINTSLGQNEAARASDIRAGRSGYVNGAKVDGSVVERNTNDLSASGDTVTVPAGIYDVQATKTITTGSVTAPGTISGSNATISVGTNTLTFTKTVSVTPSVTTTGYISSGTAGNSDVSLTANINTRDSNNLSVTTNTNSIEITAPAGYYAENAICSISLYRGGYH